MMVSRSSSHGELLLQAHTDFVLCHNNHSSLNVLYEALIAALSSAVFYFEPNVKPDSREVRAGYGRENRQKGLYSGWGISHELMPQLFKFLKVQLP